MRMRDKGCRLFGVRDPVCCSVGEGVTVCSKNSKPLSRQIGESGARGMALQRRRREYKKRTQCKTKRAVLYFSSSFPSAASRTKAVAKLVPCFLQSLSTSVSLASSSRPRSRVFALATRTSLRVLTLVSTVWSTACT